MATTAPPLAPVSLPVYNRLGQSVGKVEVDPADLGGKINKQLLHEVVLMYLANRRAGTHSTLRRGEVAGSTKKVFRQKGTGNARIGTKRTNKRRGGGTAKGPKPRDYEYHLPKKAVRSATRMAVLSKFLDNEAIIIDDLKLDGIKTKAVVEMLASLPLEGASCLIGLAESEVDEDKKVYLSARNIQGVTVQPTSQFNAYDVLKPKRLLLTKAALNELVKNAKWK